MPYRKLVAPVFVTLLLVLAALPLSRRAAEAGPCDIGTTGFDANVCSQVYGTPHCPTPAVSAQPCVAPAPGSSTTSAPACTAGSTSCFVSGGSPTTASCQVGGIQTSCTPTPTTGLPAATTAQPTPVPPPVASGVATNKGITVLPPVTPLGCGSTVLVTLQAAGATSTLPATINLTATSGMLIPPTATDSGTGVTVTYIAPDKQGGAATISATTASGASGSAPVTINCTAPAAPTPAPVAQPAPIVIDQGSVAAIAAPVPARIGIAPPNTGDGGLLR